MPKRLPASVRSYLGDAVADLIRHGWSVHFSNTEYVFTEPDDFSLESRAGGYADGEACQINLGTARRLEEWLPNFSHEYGHFKQWRNATKAQRQKDIDQYDYYKTILDNWTRKRKRYSPDALWRAAKYIAADESWAELSSLRDIKKYGLPLNYDEMVQQAVSYVLSFAFMVEERRETNPRVTEVAEVWGQIPVSTAVLRNIGLLRDTYAEHRDLYVKHCCEPWKPPKSLK